MISWPLCPWLRPDKDPYLSPRVFAKAFSAAHLTGTGVVLISVNGRAFRVCWKRKADSFIILWFLALRCTNYIGQLRKSGSVLSAFVTLRDLTKALVIRNGPEASLVLSLENLFLSPLFSLFLPSSLSLPGGLFRGPVRVFYYSTSKRTNMMPRIQILNCRFSGKQPL